MTITPVLNMKYRRKGLSAVLGNGNRIKSTTPHTCGHQCRRHEVHLDHRISRLLYRGHLNKVVPPLENQLIQVRTSNNRKCEHFFRMPPRKDRLISLIVMTQATLERHIINPTFPTTVPIPIVTPFEQQRHVQFTTLLIFQQVPLNVINNERHPTKIIVLTSCTSLRHISENYYAKQSRHHRLVTPACHPSPITIQ